MDQTMRIIALAALSLMKRYGLRELDILFSAADIVLSNDFTDHFLILPAHDFDNKKTRTNIVAL